jgi:Rad3-related DNA helicase
VNRLIRTLSDRCIIVILDNGIVTKPYGRTFYSITEVSDANKLRSDPVNQKEERVSSSP